MLLSHASRNISATARSACWPALISSAAGSMPWSRIATGAANSSNSSSFSMPPIRPHTAIKLILENHSRTSQKRPERRSRSSPLTASNSPSPRRTVPGSTLSRASFQNSPAPSCVISVSHPNKSSTEWRHTAYKQPEEARITYRFNPRFGELVQIRQQFQRGGCKFVVLDQPDGSFASFPAWMTEPTASRFEIGDEPRFTTAYSALDSCRGRCAPGFHLPVNAQNLPHRLLEFGVVAFQIVAHLAASFPPCRVSCTPYPVLACQLQQTGKIICARQLNRLFNWRKP
jgi:hypothetical protein